MKLINGVKTEQVKSFFLEVKCPMITKQWKEMKEWKNRYIDIMERKFQNDKFSMGKYVKFLHGT
jgi:hypothetical protein